MADFLTPIGRLVTGSGFLVFALFIANSCSAANHATNPKLRSLSDLEVMFYQARSEINPLYHQVLAEMPGVSGRVLIRIEIDESGKVTSCGTETENVDLESIAEKLCPIFERLDFGKGPNSKVVYPIDFILSNKNDSKQ